jgi:KDO2-lipid IV(A) lauroyltransferase
MTDDAEWPIPWRPVAGNRGGALAWVEYLVSRGVMGTVCALPIPVQDRISSLLAALAQRFDRKRTRAARAFIEQALGSRLSPEAREAMVGGAWRYFFTMLLRNAQYERRVPKATRLEHYRFEICEDARRVVAAKRGSILVSAHVGDYFAAAAVGDWVGFKPVYAVSRPPRNRPMSLAVQRTHERLGLRLLHRHGAIREIPRIVAAGGTVVLLLDQRARGRTVIAPFFGRPAHCERAIGVLIRRLRVPIVMVACYTEPEPFHYRLTMPSVVWPEELAGASPEAVSARINAEMERMILAQPEQYFWLHDRYAKAPPVAESPAAEEEDE